MLTSSPARLAKARIWFDRPGGIPIGLRQPEGLVVGQSRLPALERPSDRLRQCRPIKREVLGEVFEVEELLDPAVAIAE